MSESNCDSSADQQARERVEDLILIREAYPAQDAVSRANGWDDPSMDVYDNYDENLKRLQNGETLPEAK